MVSRQQLIAEIRVVNPSADRTWLGRFDDAQLETYRDHLQLLLEPRGRHSVWRRRPETPAIMIHEPSE